jgi:[acyl-carrier-protein] S-malonyltransferase
MLVAGVAAWRAWLPKAARAVGGRRPFARRVFGAGGLGCLTLAQAAPLVRFRRQAMQQAVPVGSARWPPILGMDAAKVQAGCAEVDGSFGPAAPRSWKRSTSTIPMQTVIAGSKAAVDKACEVLKANGAKRRLPLPVSAPFHSSLMKPAAEALRERWLGHAGAPQIPVVNNIDVAVETDPDRIRDALVRQAAGPVRWVETVQALKRAGRGHRRMRPGQGAGRHGQAHRAGPWRGFGLRSGDPCRNQQCSLPERPHRSS